MAMSLGLLVVFAGCASRSPMPDDAAESRALNFLMTEVPAWSRDNACFSCHNNGDAARALYLAKKMGFRVPADSLVDTTRWVSRPAQWDNNKGDPGFSDKTLADIQFSASLISAIEAGETGLTEAVSLAASKLMVAQGGAGAWEIGPSGTLGSPATHGTPLATWNAVRVLLAARTLAATNSAARAGQWIAQLKIESVLDASTLLMACSPDGRPWSCDRKAEGIEFLRRTQTNDGGWGPYPQTPPEPFDTAVALIALSSVRSEPSVAALIDRGRRFLVLLQNADGSWPETTRPARGQSYAQQISTTGWVTLALLRTR